MTPQQEITTFEEAYAAKFHALADEEKRTGRLPRKEPTELTSTLRQDIKKLLSSEFKSTLEIWEAVGKDRATVTNYLNEFYRAGVVTKEKRIHAMYWRLA